MQNSFGRVRRASLKTECTSQGLLQQLQQSRPENSSEDAEVWDEAIATLTGICMKEQAGQPLSDDDKENFTALEQWAAKYAKYKRNTVTPVASVASAAVVGGTRSRSRSRSRSRKQRGTRKTRRNRRKSSRKQNRK